MKRLLLTLALLLAPSLAFGQCNGVFPPNTLCGNLGATSAPPRAFASITPIAIENQFYLGGAGASDSNDCLAPTVSGPDGPCATFPHVAAVAMTYWAGAGAQQINVACGTYNQVLTVNNAAFTLSNTPYELIVTGPPATPGCVTVNGGNVNSAGTFITQGTNVFLIVENMTVECTNVADCSTLYANAGSIGYTNLIFGPATNAQVRAEAYGSYVFDFGAGNTITGGGVSHLFALNGGVIQERVGTTTCSGTVAFTNGFATASSLGFAEELTTFSGCNIVTGPRYSGTTGGIIHDNGGSLTYLPGNAPGTLTGGARYTGPVDQTLWANFTPTITCATGSPTSTTVNTSEYRTDQLTTFVVVDISLTNLTGCTQPIKISMPTTASWASELSGVDRTQALILGADIAGSGTTLTIYLPGGSMTSGDRVVISGSYGSTGP